MFIVVPDTNVFANETHLLSKKGGPPSCSYCALRTVVFSFQRYFIRNVWSNRSNWRAKGVATSRPHSAFCTRYLD